MPIELRISIAFRHPKNTRESLGKSECKNAIKLRILTKRKIYVIITKIKIAKLEGMRWKKVG